MGKDEKGMKYKYGICGPFDFNEQGTGGQSVKTREFYYVLCDTVDKDKIRILESTEWKKNPLKFVIEYIWLLRNCNHIIIFPAQNGVRILAPLSAWFKKNNKVHYSVIGGWLPQLIKDKPSLKKYLSRLDNILVETNVMKTELEIQGLNNVSRLLNFKRLNPISTDDINEHKPIRLCYFSRVSKEKGIEDAINAVKQINDTEIKCLFDIYGPIVSEYENDFAKILTHLPKEIRYCGKIKPERSIDTLKNYDIQLFPTRFPTEGIPGSVIDSYFAAVPVLAAKWNSFEDVIIDGVTGLGYQQGNFNDLCIKLEWLINHSSEISIMKHNCLKEAENYTPQTVIQSFFKLII